MHSCNNATRPIYPVISGNIIPHNWYSYIKSQTGKPDQTAITIFSEIVYWYKPAKGGGSKFESDMWRTSYEDFERKFGFNYQKVRRALVRLEELGLIKRHIRNVESKGRKYYNIMFIELLSLEPQSFVNSDVEDDKKISSDLIKFDTPSLQNCRDHIETEISIENTKNKSRSNKKSEFFEKILEKSSLKIQLGESNPRSLKEFFPLPQELYAKIQLKTSKNYRLEFVNQLLEKLASKYPSHEFPNEKAFINYMVKAVEHEIIEEKIANLENFTFDPNYKQNELERKFLSEIEDSRSEDLEARLKKKIVSLFESKDAYSILTSYKFPDKITEGRYLIARINVGEGDNVLTNYKKDRLFREIGNIFGVDYDSIKIIDVKAKTKPINNPTPIDNSMWGRVRKNLIEKYGDKGVSLDNSWFSKLEMHENKDNFQVKLVASTQFVADWVRTNYYHVIEKAVLEVFPGIKNVEINS